MFAAKTEDENLDEKEKDKLEQEKQGGEDEYEKVCYVCRRPESKAGPMITMPGDMCLCHDCMQKAFDSVTNGSLDWSKIQNMPFMNMNLNDLKNTNIPEMQIPPRQKVKKKSDAKKLDFELKDIPAPHVIKRKLDEYVIGQEKAKRVISVAVYNHYKRVYMAAKAQLNEAVRI